MLNWTLNASLGSSMELSRTLVFHNSKLSPNLWQHIVTEAESCHISSKHNVQEARVQEALVEPSETSKVEFFAECH